LLTLFFLQGGRITISPNANIFDAVYERLVLLLAGAVLEIQAAENLKEGASGEVKLGLINGVVASRRAVRPFSLYPSLSYLLSLPLLPSSFSPFPLCPDSLLPTFLPFLPPTFRPDSMLTLLCSLQRGDRIELWLGGSQKQQAPPTEWIDRLKQSLAVELELPELANSKYKRHF
jgi:hypothetical protein